MALMDESAWRGKVFLGGWSPGGGGDIAVTEPATGAEIGRVGLASAADVARAAQVAAAAQVSWAARPHTERLVQSGPLRREPSAHQVGRGGETIDDVDLALDP